MWPLPVLVLVLGLAATAGAGLQFRHVVDNRARERFQYAVGQAQSDIEARLQTYVSVLRAGAGLFASQDVEVGRAEFAAFAERLELSRRYPGIQGIGYSVRLEQPAAPSERHAILYLEPLDRRNEAAIGYDMFSEPVRRLAMERARDTGEAAASGKVELIQEIDERKQAGFLIYQPVYRTNVVPKTLEARRSELAGFVYAPFRADDLLAGIFASHGRPQLHLAVYDGAPTPENLLHRSYSDSEARDVAAAPRRETRTLVVAGRPWTMVYAARPGFGGGDYDLAWAVVVGGLLATALAVAAAWAQVRALDAADREIAARLEAEDQQKLLLDELNHRVKNTLATVQSVAAQTLRRTERVEDARATFEARLVALSQAHDLLTRDNWRGASLRDLLAAELAPHGGAAEHRVLAAGPDVWLAPNTAVAMGMAFHELATNAAKYGALSNASGRVVVIWTGDDQSSLELVWREEGGPPVTPPTRKGFGSRLILSGLAHQLGGNVILEFPPDGVQCVMHIPLPEGSMKPGSL